jgi:hypothetical protein
MIEVFFGTPADLLAELKSQMPCDAPLWVEYVETFLSFPTVKQVRAA